MTNVLTAVFDVFSAISTWFVEAIQSVVPMFYVPETGLTFIGVLSLCGLGMSVIMLIINKVQDFLRFR